MVAYLRILDAAPLPWVGIINADINIIEGKVFFGNRKCKMSLEKFERVMK